jgi:hypothetical protein
MQGYKAVNSDQKDKRCIIDKLGYLLLKCQYDSHLGNQVKAVM